MYQLEDMNWNLERKKSVYSSIAKELKYNREERSEKWKKLFIRRTQPELVWKALRNTYPKLTRAVHGEPKGFFYNQYTLLRETRKARKLHYPEKYSYRKVYYQKKSNWLKECFRNISGARGGKFYNTNLRISPNDLIDHVDIAERSYYFDIYLPTDYMSWGKLGILIGCITKNKAVFVATEPPEKIDYEEELRPFKPFAKSDANEFEFYRCEGCLLEVGNQPPVEGSAIIAVCPWTGFTAHVFWNAHHLWNLVKLANRARSTCRRRKKAQLLTLFEEVA